MNKYKIIPINASLIPNQVSASAVQTTRKINASASVAAEIKHRIETDYNLLFNKPQINAVELIGNKTLSEIGINILTNNDLENILS